MQQAEETLTVGLAAVFITAATRLLQNEHGWSREAAVAFGDRIAAEAGVVAREVIALGNDPAAALAVVGGSTPGGVDPLGGLDPLGDGPTAAAE